jgi:hypothetical protein
MRELKPEISLIEKFPAFMWGFTTYQFNENIQYVIPAGIAGIQKPRMAMLRSRPCVLDTGSPCR